MRTFVFLLFFALTTAGVTAQCSLLKGIVLDKETSESLPGAAVRLLKNSAVGTTTNADGRFEISPIAGDTLIISFIGYEEQRIALTSGCEIRIELILLQTNLDEIVIKSEKLISEEFTIRKIRKLDIYTNPSAKADPLLAVNSTPSATTTDESANISLRGSSPAETGIFLNNVPINDAVRYSQLNGIGTFSIFNTALIENVQVYPGNPPLEFGNTTSGLIALQTEETIPTKSANSVSITMASLGFFTQRKLSDKSSLTMFSNYQPSAVLKAINSKSLKNLEKFNSIDLGLHYFNKLSDRTVLKLFIYGIRESYVFSLEEPTYKGNFDQKKWRNFTVANIRHRFKNSELSFNNGLSFSSAEYQYSITDIKLNLRDFYSSLNYQYFGNNAEFKTGLSYDYKGSTFNGKYPRYDYAVGNEFPADSSSAHESVTVPEGYFYFKYFITPRLTIGTGFRKNIPANTGNFLSSQVNLNYKPTDHWSVTLSAGRYNKYQLPQGESASASLIKSDQYSADIRFTKSKFETTLSVFSKRGHASSSTYKVKGIEYYYRYTISPSLRTQLSITCLDAKDIREGKTSSSQYDINYFFRGNIEYKINGTWSITTVFLFRQGSFYQPVSGTTYDASLDVYAPTYGQNKRLPDYNLIDVSISKIFLIKECTAIAFCGLGNIIDFKNVRGYSYNFDYSKKKEQLFSQRTIFFGLVLNF